MGPEREHTQNPDGSWTVKVTPPAWSGMTQGASVTLTSNQYARYQKWMAGEGLIQDMLHDLFGSDREILMTGIGPQEWDDTFKDEEDE